MTPSGGSITFLRYNGKPSILVAAPSHSIPAIAAGILTSAVVDVMLILGSMLITGILIKWETADRGKCATGSAAMFSKASASPLANISTAVYSPGENLGYPRAKSTANVKKFEEKYPNGKTRIAFSGGTAGNGQFLLDGTQRW